MSMEQTRLLDPGQKNTTFAETQGSNSEELLGDSRNSIETALKSIFPTKQEESKLQKARKTLGDTAKDMPDEELESYLTEFQYLLDCWLDSF